MTLDEFNKRAIHLRELDKEYDELILELCNERHRNSRELRNLYQEYIDANFPYKSGSGDTLYLNLGTEETREIIVTKVSGENCNLDNIVIYYNYDKFTSIEIGKLSCININGICRLDPNKTLIKYYVQK